MSQSKRFLFKIVVVGDGGIGKSTMIQRLITGKYIEQKITIGTDLASWSLDIADMSIKPEDACFMPLISPFLTRDLQIFAPLAISSSFAAAILDLFSSSAVSIFFSKKLFIDDTNEINTSLM